MILGVTIAGSGSVLPVSRNDGANPGDLNLYSIPGLYTFEGMPNASNAPADLAKNHAHLLIVAKSAVNVAQILIDTEGNDGHIFVRYQVTGTYWRILK